MTTHLLLDYAKQGFLVALAPQFNVLMVIQRLFSSGLIQAYIN
jgi:hypothetical protein